MGKNKFNADENAEIFDACNELRSFFVVTASFSGLINEEIIKQTEKICKDAGKGSEIDTLINRNEWNDLFKNKFWLSLLEGIQNLYFLNQRDFIFNNLKIITEYFPLETGFINMELFNSSP